MGIRFEVIQDILDIDFGCWVNVNDERTPFTDWFADKESAKAFCTGATVKYITANNKGELVIELEGNLYEEEF